MKIHVNQTSNGVINIFDDASAASVEKTVQAALRQGYHVKRAGGVKQWLDDFAVFDNTKSGSDAYIWDKSGNKVLHHRYLVTSLNGKITKTFKRKVWKLLD